MYIYKVPSTKCQVQSAKYKVQSAKYKVQSTKCQVQSIKCQVQSTMNTVQYTKYIMIGSQAQARLIKQFLSFILLHSVKCTYINNLYLIISNVYVKLYFKMLNLLSSSIQTSNHFNNKNTFLIHFGIYIYINQI